MPKIPCTCGRTLAFKAEFAGKVAKCPACSAAIRLPLAEEALPSEPPAPRADGNLYELEGEQPADEPPPDAEPASKFDLQPAAPLPGPKPYPTPSVRAPAASVPAPHPPPPPPAQPVVADESQSGSFWSAIPGAFAYPFKENGLVALAIGVIFSTVARFIAAIFGCVPIIGIVLFLIAHIVLLGYCTGYLMCIMERSAHGDDDPPDWPDLNDYVDTALKPFLFILALGILCIGPALAYSHFVDGASTSIAVLILLGGLLYLPMGLLAVALTDNVVGLYPVHVIRAIFCVPGRYVVAWVLCGISVGAPVASGAIIAAAFPVPIIGPLLQRAIGFYFMFVLARIMGLLYHTGRDRLEWLGG